MSQNKLFPETITVETDEMNMHRLLILEKISEDSVGWPVKRFLDSIAKELRDSISDVLPVEPEEVGSIIDLPMVSGPLVRINNGSRRHWMLTMTPSKLYTWDEISALMLDMPKN